MHFTEEQTALLKVWVIKKLEDISDADADVLADYAIALISTEDSDEVARANCIENLTDFLPSNAEQFVSELFEVIANKSYDPSQPKAKLAPPTPQVPTGPKNDALGSMNESRKRSLQWDKDETFGQNGQFQGGNRPIKQMRRSGRGGFERGGRQQQGQMAPFAPQQSSQQPNMGNNSLPSHGLPPLDPNNPMAMMALQQFMGAMSEFQNPGSPQNGLPFRPPGSAQRCRNYDTMGFCASGAQCPYDHDDNRVIVPPQSQEYDPSNAMLNIAPNTNGNFNTFNPRGRGGMRGRGQGTTNFRGGGQRSDFSMLGPNRNSDNTSIVVEQIPDDKLEEQAIRDFFSEFGNIEEVTMFPERKLAIVKYESKQGAKGAYQSPKVVFDNRFVKVYWYNSEKFEQQHSGPLPTKSIKTEDVQMQDDEQQIDQAELAKRQDEAQRKHEEARKQREEAVQQKASLDQQLKAMEAERKKMADLLAKKAGKAASPAAGSPMQNGDEESESTRSLKATLAKLEAEAKSLGIDPDAPATNGYDSFSSPPYRGRGGFRGRGRGRGHYQPYRGGWGGGAARGGAVMRLDNRPKTIAVAFANDNNYDANDEALRQFLLFNSMETASITKHPEKEDAALITFNQRYEGENFMLAARAELPHAGKVEASWYGAAAPVNGVKVENGTNGTNGFADVKMEGDGQGDAGEREIYVGGEREMEEQDLDRFA